jgi:hypothetical protein
LVELLKQAAALAESDYTAASWQVLQDAVDGGWAYVAAATGLAPLADVPAGLLDAIAKLEAALAGLEPLKPSQAKVVRGGVYAVSPVQEFLYEDIGEAGALAKYTFSGSGFDRVGSVNLRLSYKADVADGITVALAAALAGKAEVRVEDVAEPVLDGYVTKSVYILAKGLHFSAADGAALLNISLALKTDKPVVAATLLLSHFDAAYYDPAYQGGNAGYDADASVDAAAATVEATFRSRFDVNGDGKVTLADVNQVRQYLGTASADAAWAAAATSDLAANGVIDLADLTLIIAAYEATVG